MKLIRKFKTPSAHIKRLPIIVKVAAIFVSFVVCALAVEVGVIPPKLRVEVEFQKLEMSIGRCIYREMLPSPNLAVMNNVLYGFMQDNPGVIRMLRTNAGGLTVNDVSASSSQSAPPRDVKSQYWFKHIVQNKTPYYSMDEDTATGDILLFYAWPLLGGPDGARFSGTFAVTIDFTAQAALIDDAPPFQMARRGKVFFQHEWDDGDFNEEPLEIKGAGDITIRTPKPLATKLDPRQERVNVAQAPKKTEITSSADDDDDEYIASLLGESASGRKSAKSEGGGFINNAIFVLLLAIAIMLAYMLFKGRLGENIRSAENDPSMPLKINYDQIAVKPTAEKPVPQHSVAGGFVGNKIADNVGAIGVDIELPVVGVDKIADGGLYKVNNVRDKSAETDMSKDQQKMMSKMLKLIKKEFDLMDEKIEILSKRVEQIEKKQ